MLKTALLLLIFNALVDFLIGFGGALGTAMVATENGAMPSWSAIIIAALTGLTAAMRTIQPVLKSMLQEYLDKLGSSSTASAVVSAASKT